MRRKITLILWALTGTFIVGTILFFCAIWNGWIGYMPDIEELENPISNAASEIISADGETLGTLSRDRENRIIVGYNEIAPCVFKALVATEDKRFFEHSGIDIRSLLRAIFKRGMLGQHAAGGGSTITQQLAKQLYSNATSNSTERLLQKANEWMIALKLEHYYSKNEILTLYLNYFDFLHQGVGIKNAAKVYFNKMPSELTVPEAAMLIGMCKNPSYFNPIREAERVKDRRDVVLDLMAEARCITETEAQSYKAQDLGLNFRRVSRSEGRATYFREYLAQIMMAERPERSKFSSQQEYEDALNLWNNDPLYGWCKKNLNSEGDQYDIYSDGLKIYTSIDSRMQKYAEEAVREHLSNTLQPAFNSEKKGTANYPYASGISQSKISSMLQKAIEQSQRYKTMKENGATEDEIRQAFRTPVRMTVFSHNGDIETTMTPLDSIKYYKAFLQCGFMSMDPVTGYVKAYVGGINYAHFQYDMCSKAHRQVGSTIKPYLYTLAIYNDMSPDDQILNVEKSYGNWTPRNGSRARYGEMVPLRWALAQSNNWVSAALIDRYGPHALINMLHKFGINHNYQATLPLCLGTSEISVMEMVAAYTAFANDGQRVKPILVTRIEDRNGKELARFNTEAKEVINSRMAYTMLDMMKGVINEGTGRRLRSEYNFSAEIAGKTGTSQNNSDGWFMGIVPRLVTGCWVGGESPDIHFNSTAIGQGASMALPIWARYMRKVYGDRSLGYFEGERFPIPDSIPSDIINYNQPYYSGRDSSGIPNDYIEEEF